MLCSSRQAPALISGNSGLHCSSFSYVSRFQGTQSCSRQGRAGSCSMLHYAVPSLQQRAVPKLLPDTAQAAAGSSGVPKASSRRRRQPTTSTKHAAKGQQVAGSQQDPPAKAKPTKATEAEAPLSAASLPRPAAGSSPHQVHVLYDLDTMRPRAWAELPELVSQLQKELASDSSMAGITTMTGFASLGTVAEVPVGFYLGPRVGDPESDPDDDDNYVLVAKDFIECPMCDAEFLGEQALHNHMQLAHSGWRPKAAGAKGQGHVDVRKALKKLPAVKEYLSVSDMTFVEMGHRDEAVKQAIFKHAVYKNLGPTHAEHLSAWLPMGTALGSSSYLDRWFQQLTRHWSFLPRTELAAFKKQLLDFKQQIKSDRSAGQQSYRYVLPFWLLERIQQAAEHQKSLAVQGDSEPSRLGSSVLVLASDDVGLAPLVHEWLAAGGAGVVVVAGEQAREWNTLIKAWRAQAARTGRPGSVKLWAWGPV